MIEDILTLGESAIRGLFDTGRSAKAPLLDRLAPIVDILGLVRRDEFESALAMISKARAMQEDLNDRLNAIESKLNLSRKASAPKTKNRRLRSVKHRAIRKKTKR
jgi:BMFP domain-containing protein YqiC